ncbi:hypothetical protein [Fodinibius sediminis]|uniref:Lipoprotein n=1 Tax=Fodinibius sediminis TaxID=1214077 RepID=A0A521CQG7_9BACT|nr:hypothetical protein [Fodinibius sediminis]SMO60910.1 hypothetical protein SAMN06265218_106252 [Fodinibius sediminis]
MLKFYLFSALSLILLGGCASSEHKQQTDDGKPAYPDLVELKDPETTPHQNGKVYVDSVRQVTVKSREALLISGSLADGCTHLASIDHRIAGQTLIIELSAWRNADRMCTQALVPFSFIYDKLKPEELKEYSTATINGQKYSL